MPCDAAISALEPLKIPIIGHWYQNNSGGPSARVWHTRRDPRGVHWTYYLKDNEQGCAGRIMRTSQFWEHYSETVL